MNQKTLTNFFLLFLLLAALAPAHLLFAAELVNINTADIAELETLPGVGPSIAQSIIDNRPYASIQEVSRANGIGEPGSSSYEKIKDLITVSGSSDAQTAATSSTQTQTSAAMQAESQTQASGAGPPTLTVRITADSRSVAGGGSYFSAVAYGTEDTLLPAARFIWNFGDGATAEGIKVFHAYAYPGRYAVFVTASYNYSAGIDRVTVEAVSAAVSLEASGDGSLLIRNDSKKEVNIGLWSLVDMGKTYVLPEGTIVLAGEGVRFAAAITGLSGTPAAKLLYPNSALAAAATVSADSPLRGERVTKKTTPIPAVSENAPQKTPPVKSIPAAGEVLGATAPAPPLEDKSASSSLWMSLAALAVLLASGAGAVHYLGFSAKHSETPLSTDEFKIE